MDLWPQVYYSGMPRWPATGLPLRRHGDELAALLPPGNAAGPQQYAALGRCDDTMNLGGIKVGDPRVMQDERGRRGGGG